MGYIHYNFCNHMTLIVIGLFAMATIFTSNATFFRIMVLDIIYFIACMEYFSLLTAPHYHLTI